MIMSKSSFCCFISSWGGCSFLFQKSYPIFCLDTRYTPSGALLSRLVWLIMCSVQRRTGISDAVQSIHQSNKIHQDISIPNINIFHHVQSIFHHVWQLISHPISRFTGSLGTLEPLAVESAESARSWIWGVDMLGRLGKSVINWSTGGSLSAKNRKYNFSVLSNRKVWVYRDWAMYRSFGDLGIEYNDE